MTENGDDLWREVGGSDPKAECDHKRGVLVSSSAGDVFASEVRPEHAVWWAPFTLFRDPTVHARSSAELVFFFYVLRDGSIVV